MEQKKMGERTARRLIFAVIACLVLILGIQYWNYMQVAGSTVPIMDFWHWTRVYGEKVQNGTITFSDYFFSDQGEHIQPLAMALQFGVLKASQFDVRPLVTWGAAVRILLACLMTAAFLWYYRDRTGTHRILLVLAAAGIAASVLNYNQWEMTTEPFSLGNALRLLLYYLSFAWAAWFLADFRNRSQRANLLHGALLGVYCAFLTVLVGSAYFVGHLPAIGLIFVWAFLRHPEDRKRYLMPMVFWCVISLAGALIYYYFYSLGGRASLARSIPMKTYLVLLLESVVLFWGAAVLPSGLMDSLGDGVFYITGTLVFLAAVVVLIRYLRKDREERNLFPAVLALYALVISTAIAWGRVENYGANGMTSSRYVIESSIGLVGLFWMSYDLAAAHPARQPGALRGAAVCFCLLALLGYSGRAENQTASYREIYNDNLRDMILHVEDYSDDELGMAQASTEDVRWCVEFFRENGLSVFAEK